MVKRNNKSSPTSLLRLRHRRPHHALVKRPTYHHHIRARSHEKQARTSLSSPSSVSSRSSVASSAAPPSLTPIPPTVRPELPPIIEDINELIPPSSPLPGVPSMNQKTSTLAEDLHDWILGGQDGVVNVLGTILGVAIVTQDKRVVIVAGVAALLAESISMAAVAYTSVRASHSYYHSERERQLRAIHENPQLQREILVDVYKHKGLSHADAHRVVTELTKNEEVWLETMMEEHLRMYEPEESGPMHSAIVVGLAAIIGSLVPLMPFLFLPIVEAIYVSCITSVLALFAAGAATAKLTIGDWKARGMEMMMIGGLAAAVSFGIGYMFTHGIIPLS